MAARQVHRAQFDDSGGDYFYLTYTLYDEGTVSPYLIVSLSSNAGRHYVLAHNILWQPYYQASSSTTLSGAYLVVADTRITTSSSLRISLKPGGEYCILAASSDTPTTGWGDRFGGSKPLDPSEPYGWHCKKNSLSVTYNDDFGERTSTPTEAHDPADYEIVFNVGGYVPPEPSTDTVSITDLSAEPSADKSSLVISYGVDRACSGYLYIYEQINSANPTGSNYKTRVSVSPNRGYNTYSYTDAQIGQVYGLRLDVSYGSASDSAQLASVWMPPLNPVASAKLGSAADRTAIVTSTYNGVVFNDDTSIEIDVQYLNEDGTFTSWQEALRQSGVTVGVDPVKTRDYSVTIERAARFRVRYTYYNLYSDWVECVSTVYPYDPPADGEYAGIYIFDGDFVDSSKVKLRIRHADQGEYSPRTGYRVYVDGSQIQTLGVGDDGSTEEFGPFDIPDMTGKTYSLGVQAYGPGGSSALVQMAMYGRAAKPRSLTYSRGFSEKDGFWTSVKCDGTTSNNYSVRTSLSLSKPSSNPMTLVVDRAGDFTGTWTKETKNYETVYTVSNMTVSATTMPVNIDVSPIAKWRSEPLEVAVDPQGYEIPEGTLTVTQRSVSEEGKGTYEITWNEALFEGQELADKYQVIIYESDGYTEHSRVTVDAHSSTGLSVGQPYSLVIDGMVGLCAQVTPIFHEYAGRNSFFAADVEGLTFIGPVIVDAWVDGFTGHVVFTPARGGVPRTEPSGGKSYRYRVYLGTSRTRSKPDDEVFTVRGDRAIEYTFGIYTPYPARVTVSAIDENGTESPRSNSLLVQRFFVQRDVEGVGAYAFNSDLVLRDVGIYGYGYSLMTNGSTVHIQDSDVQVPRDGRLYIIEGDDDVIMETAVTYELET